MTLEEVAKELGVTRQRVFQIEQRALNKVRKYLISKGFDMQDIPYHGNNFFSEGLTPYQMQQGGEKIRKLNDLAINSDIDGFKRRISSLDLIEKGTNEDHPINKEKI